MIRSCFSFFFFKMLNRVETTYFGIGLILRIFFMFFQSTTRNYFENSGEFVTPLNSWKRSETFCWNFSYCFLFRLVTEGIYLRQLDVSPFLGSVVHEVCEKSENLMCVTCSRHLDPTLLAFLYKIIRIQR